jgi:hypothetical protein
LARLEAPDSNKNVLKMVRLISFASKLQQRNCSIFGSLLKMEDVEMRIDDRGGMEEKRQETINNIAEIKKWLKNHNIRRLPVVNADVLNLFFSPGLKLSKIQSYFPCSVDELITYRGK